MSRMEERIEIDPDVMTGKPVIKGTRIPVQKILHQLGHGMSVEEILEDYPHLEKEDVQAAVSYAADILEQEKVFPLNGDEVEVSS